MRAKGENERLETHFHEERDDDRRERSVSRAGRTLAV